MQFKCLLIFKLQSETISLLRHSKILMKTCRCTYIKQRIFHHRTTINMYASLNTI